MPISRFVKLLLYTCLYYGFKNSPFLYAYIWVCKNAPYVRVSKYTALYMLILGFPKVPLSICPHFHLIYTHIYFKVL